MLLIKFTDIIAAPAIEEVHEPFLAPFPVNLFALVRRKFIHNLVVNVASKKCLITGGFMRVAKLVKKVRVAVLHVNFWDGTNKIIATYPIGLHPAQFQEQASQVL